MTTIKRKDLYLLNEVYLFALFSQLFTVQNILVFITLSDDSLMGRCSEMRVSNIRLCLVNDVIVLAKMIT